MNDMKILENYAKEFMEVLEAYNPENIYQLVIQGDICKIYGFKNGKGESFFVFRIKNGFVVVNNFGKNQIFWDGAPFKNDKKQYPYNGFTIAPLRHWILNKKTGEV
jgi:hypothetical protein